MVSDSDPFATLLKKSLRFGRESASILRPLKREERFRLDQIKQYLKPTDFRMVQNYLKKGKVNLIVKKIGLSSILANNDLQPYLESKLDIIGRINEIISQKFEQTLDADFSPRAWQMIQEYVGGKVLGLRNIKKILTLMLFSEDINLNINNMPANEEDDLTTAFKKLGVKQNVMFNSKGGFDLGIRCEKIESNEFMDMAERIIAGEKHAPTKADLKFIKKYISQARDIQPELSPELADRVKDFVIKLKETDKKLPFTLSEGAISGIVKLIKASARVELRNDVQTKDLERVFSIISPQTNSNKK